MIAEGTRSQQVTNQPETSPTDGIMTSPCAEHSAPEVFREERLSTSHRPISTTRCPTCCGALGKVVSKLQLVDPVTLSLKMFAILMATLALLGLLVSLLTLSFASRAA